MMCHSPHDVRCAKTGLCCTLSQQTDSNHSAKSNIYSKLVIDDGVNGPKGNVEEVYV